MDYGESQQEQKYQEKDVNGNWCYTDTFGNYEYCDEYADALYESKSFRECITPDKNGFQIAAKVLNL